MQISVRFFCKNRRIPSDTMNDEEVRAHHPTSLMDENEGCIFYRPCMVDAKKKKIQGKRGKREKEKRYKAKGKEKKIQGKREKDTR